MALYESVQYDNIGLFTFLTRLNDVMIYPEAIRIKVALDDGSVIGFSAEEYIGTHKQRELPKPKITEQDAREYINKNVKIMDSRMALINDSSGEDVLCYEFIGTLDDDTYRIFINAIDGEEEYVEQLQNVEPIYNDLIKGRAE